MRKLFFGALLAGATIASLAPNIKAASFEPDTTFGAGGMVTTQVGSQSQSSTHRAIIQQADGKIVAVGYGLGLFSTNDDFTVVRYLANGSLDASFNGNGKAITDFGGTDHGHAVALQSDGKILVAGYTTKNGPADFALARYLANGVLDSTFGVNGKVVTDFDGGALDIAESVCIQNDGKIIVAGYGVEVSWGVTHFALARYASNGALDATFNGSGKVMTPILHSSQARSVKVQNDGKIVAAGQSYDGSLYDEVALARYMPNGSLDTTFNGSGILIASTSNGDDFGRAMVIQADGKIVVGGTSFPGGNPRFSVARFLTNGAFDTSFGTGGKVLSAIGPSSAYLNGLTLLGDGRIVAVGETWGGSNYDMAMLCYQANGTTDGISMGFDSGANDLAYGAAVQGDGKILVAGASEVAAGNSTQKMFVRRYLAGATSSATLTNVQARLVDTLDYYEVSYDLAVTGGTAADVKLEASIDGGLTWSVPIFSVVGDVGPNTSSGTAKTAKWLFRTDGFPGTGLTPTNVQLRLTAATPGSTVTSPTQIVPAPDNSHPREPQKVVFCYGSNCPFRMETKDQVIQGLVDAGLIADPGELFSIQSEAQAMPVPTSPVNIQQGFFNAVRDVFYNLLTPSEITFSIGAPQPDAINVYFVPLVDIDIIRDWRGRGETPGKSVDRFNTERMGNVAVVYDPSFNHAAIVETIAHEIGHCLGLAHIDPKYLPDWSPLSPGLGWNECMMDYIRPPAGTPISAPMSFFNEPAWIADPLKHLIHDFDEAGNGLYRRSNEQYHLLRWVAGRDMSTTSLTPGEWDEEVIVPSDKACLARFEMTTSQTLYNVKVFQSDHIGVMSQGMGGGMTQVAEFASISPSQWAQLELNFSSQGAITLVGSSSPTLNQSDIVAVAIPGGLGMDAQIPVSGIVPLELLQQTGPTTFNTIGTGEVRGQTVPQALSTDVRILRAGNEGNSVNITFTAQPGETYIIERSADQINWTVALPDTTASDTYFSFTDVDVLPAMGTQFWYRIRVPGPMPQDMAHIEGGTLPANGSTGFPGGSASSFLMGTHEVSGAVWSEAWNWGITHGYFWFHQGEYTDPSHPVVMINWYDMIKWCNARSEMEGLRPCYYEDAGLTQVYRDWWEIPPHWDQSADGYRLPTEVEWELAARAGASTIYPWGNTITGGDANFGNSGDPYELTTNRTTPVGYYNGSQTPAGLDRSNAYGLYDVCGNVAENCWATVVDSFSAVPVRGGSMVLASSSVVLSTREYFSANGLGGHNSGFRFARALPTAAAAHVYKVILPPQADDHGNTASTATAIALSGGQVNATLSAFEDEDYFRIVVPETGTVRIFTNGGTDTRGVLMDASGAIVAENDDSTDGNFSVTRRVAAGTYYIKVGGASGGTVGDYALSTSFAASWANGYYYYANYYFNYFAATGNYSLAYAYYYYFLAYGNYYAYQEVGDLTNANFQLQYRLGLYYYNLFMAQGSTALAIYYYYYQLGLAYYNWYLYQGDYASASYYLNYYWYYANYYYVYYSQ